MRHWITLLIATTLFLQSTYAQTNSYLVLAKPVTDFVSMKYSEQVSEALNAAKKEKDRQRIQEEGRTNQKTINKLSALNAARLTDLNTFISSMSSPVVMPSDEVGSDILVYVSPAESQKEILLYLFLDGNCYGAGTLTKGLISQIPSDVFADGLHEMVLIASCAEAPVPLIRAFSSTVHFGVKTNFSFEVKKKGRGIELLLN